MPRPPRNRRLPHAAFPRRAFAAAERTRTAAIRTLGQPRAVITGEDDECVLIQTLGTQRLEDLTDTPIHFFDPVAEATILGFTGEGRAGVDGRVDGVMGKVEVEGLFLVTTDEVDGLLGVDFDQAGLGVPVHQFDDLLISQEGHDRDFRVSRLLQHVVRIGDPEVVVEALPGG